MLPEIALTSQIIRRLQKHFGGYIGIYHSKFSQNERVEIWNKVKTGEVKIVLGARSSLFLPFQDLGLIICDEEHDTSYKQQDPAPRYQWKGCGYLLWLPDSMQKFYWAVLHLLWKVISMPGMSKYGLVELQERFGDVKLPSIEMIDTRMVARKPGKK